MLAGFTITELVAVIAIAGVLAAVLIPRLSASSFDEARLHQDTVTALRYAQRTAVAYQRTVCATFTSTQLTLTYDANYGGTSCSGSLPAPGGNAPAYVVKAAGSATYASASTFNFDRIGKPSASQTITLSGGSTITVENETGYVH